MKSEFTFQLSVTSEMPCMCIEGWSKQFIAFRSVTAATEEQARRWVVKRYEAGNPGRKVYYHQAMCTESSSPMLIGKRGVK